ncbi:MAG: hypothetical protein WCO57_01980 [Verrucomicrobiota bacterium]
MKRLACLGLAICGLCTLGPARNEVPLPAWDESARKTQEKSGWLPGTRILTDDADPDPPQTAAPVPLEEIKPVAGELAENPAPPVAIPEKYLAAYFGARPESFLTDPQNLLDKRSTRERLNFLKGHAADSVIDLYIYVFNKDQEIPGEVREEELMERFFADGRPALLVYYYLGAPQQATLHLSPALTERVSAALQRRTLQSAIMQAMEKSNPQDQLEVFSVQLAIRSYWMEQLVGGITGNGTQAPAQPRASKQPKKPASLAERWSQLQPIAEPLAIPGLLLGGTLGFALSLGAWLRWRATYRFPEFAVEPRLGGRHAAGVGAVLGFSRSALPPPSQRAQLTETWRCQ